MSDDDVSYYEERARQEAQAAERAESETAASAHRLLALEYEAHARSLRERPAMPQLGDKAPS
jgi:hypothetical protein